MEPLDPMDSRIAGWWKITKWDPKNDNSSADQFPPGAFVPDVTQAHLVRPKDETFQIVWLDKDGQDCSLDYSRAATTRVSFAGHTFLCGIKPDLILLDAQAPRELRLTVTLTTLEAADGFSTGNTGTFIAQSVPDPPPYGAPGQDEPGK